MEKDEKILKSAKWDRVGLLSKITFRWIFPIFIRGWKQSLEFQDMYKAPAKDDVKILSEKLTGAWKKQLASKKPSLACAIFRTFGFEWITLNLVGMYEEWLLRLFQPILLGIVVRYFSDPGSVEPLYAYLCAAGVCLCSALFIATHHPYILCSSHIGMRVRIACMGLIYRKLLKLHNSSLSKTTVGQIINLLSNDVNRFDEVSIMSGYIILAPIQGLIVVLILWQYLGPSSLVGVAILTFFVPFQGVMGRFFAKIRRKTASLTDERIRLMSEIIGGMKVIKMYSWEKPFADLIAKIRKREVSRIRMACMLKAINLSLFFVTSRIVLFACFVTYVLVGGHLSAEKVFVTVAMFNNLRMSVTSWFPQAIGLGAEALVSCKRIQKFLLLEEKEVRAITPNISCSDNGDDKNGTIVVQKLFGWWSKDSEEPCLKNIFADIKRGELLAVIGSVGSGKSSFLMALLNELSHYKGSISVKGEIAYASQEPWSFNESIRNNILFGREYDEEKYKKVAYVTSLNRDFKLLQFGDKTLVGEKGVSLSGGQKARVSLARALYSSADIYLLDDPLSAVDAAVAKHIFEKCIMGYLENKTRVLVTHQIQFIEKADKILVLQDGKSIAYGTYDELINTGLDFLNFIHQEKKEQNKEANEEKIVRHSSRSQSFIASECNDPGVTDFEMQPKVEEETKMMGSVKATVYWQYIKSGAGVFFVLIVVIATILSQTLFHACDFWLTFWTNAEDNYHFRTFFNSTNSSIANGTMEEAATPSDDSVNSYYTIIYCALNAALFITTLMRATTFFSMCMRASVNLHNKIFFRLLRSPMLIFDKNPVGRILNRFARDLGIIDESMPATSFDLNLTLLNAFGIMVVVAIINIYLVIPAIMMTFFIFCLRNIYIRTARDIKRYEGMARSPVYSHVNTTITGLTTLRAFKREESFQQQFNCFLNDHSGTWFLFLCSSRALGVVLDWVCISYIIVVTAVLMAFPDGMPGGNVGLALSSALMLTGMFQWGVRQSAEFENQMTAVERIIEYTTLPSEAELNSSPENKPPPDWPNEGKIEFKSVYLRYESAQKPVLSDLNISVKGGEKVGIVGRTGAGKSSLLSCLFRICEPEGSIIIDGIDIQSIGLHDLRSKISIIPQDPVLFAGTVRYNIDPFSEKTDADLWQVLEEVQLKEVIVELNGQLDAKITGGGSNFSVGQRQLICLARALLRRNKILVIDEATANVDHVTDSLIQEKIREQFKDCTVLTIAHRLNTIIDSDKVLVLDAGKVEEFDSPYILLKNDSSLFSKLVKQTGSQMYEKLYKQSMHHHFAKANPNASLHSIAENEQDDKIIVSRF